MTPSVARGAAARLFLLLVEDNPGDADLVSEHLGGGDAGIDLHVAPTLASARTAMLAHKFDGVLLDLNLPDSRGLDTLLALRACRADLPLIVLSGGVAGTLRTEALRAGAAEVIDKCAPRDHLFISGVLYAVERHRALQRQAQLSALVDSCPDAMLVVNDAGTIRYVNAASERLFGRVASELLGETMLFAVASGEAAEVTIHRSEDTPRIGELRVVAFDWLGEAASLITVRDVTARRQDEELRARSERLEAESRVKSEFLAELEDANLRLARQNEDLARAKAGAEVLVREVHHRVKNNLQIISSLLHLQADQLSSEEAIAVFDKTCQRVGAIAKAHEHLYQTQDLDHVDAANYIRSIVEQLRVACGSAETCITIDYDVAAMPLPIDLAVPCGIIINELITNALKHAFVGRERGRIFVSLRQLPGREIELSIADDGVGKRGRSGAGSFGLELVETFAEQLQATADTRCENGTRVSLRFPDPRPPQTPCTVTPRRPTGTSLGA